MIARLAGRMAALAGWRRGAAAAALGALAALALPPLGAFVLLVPAFTGLAWLLDGAASGPRAVRRGLWTGFAFGFGHFLVSVHWIVEPLLIDAARTAWMIPFALPGLAAVLAAFPAAACAVATACTRRARLAPVARVLALALAWVAMEWVRGWIFTGFPWNLIGYTWSGVDAVMQLTALTGIHGLSLLTVAAAAMPAVLALPGPGARRRAVAAAAATLLLPALLWAGGLARLAAAPAPGEASVPGVQLRIVQANIPQRLKWEPELRVRHVETYVRLSTRSDGPPPTHVIWPETAVPFFLAADGGARRAAALAAPEGGLLITGAPRVAMVDGERRLFNSAHAIDRSGAVLASYDKTHLVPFGEYVPLRGILPLDKIVPGQGDFARGPGPRSLSIPGLPPVSPLICYEVIFPGKVVAPGERPGLLLNLTNDGWFGRLAGPQQHFAIAATRAVEEGLPLVRAAGTGISAVVDPWGRVVARLDIGVQGVIDSPLPAALAPTPYARWGDLVPALLGLLVVGIAVAGRGWDGRSPDRAWDAARHGPGESA